MEAVEITSEGAMVHFSRYDLAILTSVLKELCHDVDPAEFAEKMGCSLLEVQRLLEKFDKTNETIINS